MVGSAFACFRETTPLLQLHEHGLGVDKRQRGGYLVLCREVAYCWCGRGPGAS